MVDLNLDTETYNEADLKQVGTYRYAETAEVMLFPYAIDDAKVQLWDRTETKKPPAELKEALDEAQRGTEVTVIAQNSMFDRNVLRLGDLKLEIPIERWDDTMVQALSHALPPALAMLGQVLGLPEWQSKKRGDALIRRFCSPAPRNHKAERYTRETHPREWEEFKEYAIGDVEAMRECRRRMPTWNWQEQDIADWHLDQHINDRGFAVDLDLVHAGAEAAIREKAQIEERFAELTGGLRPTQRERVKQHMLGAYGLELVQTARHVMEPLSEDLTQPEAVREIATLMLQANRTSTAKYAKMADAVSSDGRFRGGLQFAGASRTRRWAGRVFQPQNLPSRGLPKDIDCYIGALKNGVHDLLFEDLMLYGAAALRGIVVAGE